MKCILVQKCNIFSICFVGSYQKRDFLMSENLTTDVNDKNRNDDGFPTVTLAVILLICVWIVAGFTIAIYATISVLTAHFVSTFCPHCTSIQNEIRQSSSSQVCIRCSSQMKSNFILESSAIHMKSMLNCTKNEINLETAL